jgi:transposase
MGTTGLDREIAAAYASGLSLAACAEKFGVGRGAVRGAVKRTGIPFRRPGPPVKLNGAAVAAHYRAGRCVNEVAHDLGVSVRTAWLKLRQEGTERRTRSESQQLRYAREAQERAEYPWAAKAAARHQAGESVTRLAREYRVGWRTAKEAIERQGVTIMPGRPGRPPAARGDDA